MVGKIFGSSDRIIIEGLDDLAAALRNLFPPSKANGIMRKVLTARARPIADRAEQMAPRRTGQLQRSITVSSKLSKRQRSLHKKVDPADVEVFAGAGPVAQSSLTEYGTSHIAPHPFMRPAWDAARADLLTNIGQDLWTEITKGLK